MITTDKKFALFDNDGVVMNTEPQYLKFWNAQGMEYLHKEDYGNSIKGQTLSQVLAYFPEDKRDIVEKRVLQFEHDMVYDYVPGAYEFLVDLHKNGVQTAMVTSSDDIKMESVYRSHAELKELFDVMITADKFIKSKPDPECFFVAMKELHADASNTIIFEDSMHGLKAARETGAKVIGLATTFDRSKIIDKADYIIEDFSGKDYNWLLPFYNK